MEQDPFKEYIKETEPEKRDKGYAWHTAIGLQAVDGLRPSKYLIDTAIKNIEGDISIDEAGELLNSYYKENFIKYLRTLGFDAANDIFAEHAWYFRNALVRANYTDLKNGVHETTEYLELFLKNLLLDEKNELHNRTMHVSGKFNNLQKADIGEEKADIGEEKADIGEEKADIAIKIANIDEAINSKTRSNILALYQYCGKETFFGRTVVELVTGLKSTRASEVLQLLLRNNIIEKVQGHGKGKYRFL